METVNQKKTFCSNRRGIHSALNQIEAVLENLKENVSKRNIDEAIENRSHDSVNEKESKKNKCHKRKETENDTFCSSKRNQRSSVSVLLPNNKLAKDVSKGLKSSCYRSPENVHKKSMIAHDLRSRSPRNSSQARHGSLAQGETDSKKFETSKLPAKKNGTKQIHNYTNPTLASRYRTKLSAKQSNPDENRLNELMPFIPSAGEGTSHHLGTLIQQEIGKLKTLPLQHVEGNQHKRPETRLRKSLGHKNQITEEEVKNALENLQQELHRKLSS